MLSITECPTCASTRATPEAGQRSWAQEPPGASIGGPDGFWPHDGPYLDRRQYQISLKNAAVWCAH